MTLFFIRFIALFSVVTVWSMDTCPDTDGALLFAAQAGDLPLVRCLARNGVDLNSQDSINRTALMWALIKDHDPSEDNYDKIAAYLIEKGAKLGL